MSSPLIRTLEDLNAGRVSVVLVKVICRSYLLSSPYFFFSLLRPARDGYNAWRDGLKPSELLSKLCRDHGLEEPLFRPGRISVADKVFVGKTCFMHEGEGPNRYVPLCV